MPTCQSLLVTADLKRKGGYRVAFPGYSPWRRKRKSSRKPLDLMGYRSSCGYLEPDRIVDKAGSVGKGIPGVTLEVCRPDGSRTNAGEVGEIVASGENIMAGYWRQPQATAKVLKEGKLWTGDLARMDKDVIRGAPYFHSMRSQHLTTN